MKLWRKIPTWRLCKKQLHSQSIYYASGTVLTILASLSFNVYRNHFLPITIFQFPCLNFLSDQPPRKTLGGWKKAESISHYIQTWLWESEELQGKCNLPTTHRSCCQVMKWSIKGKCKTQNTFSMIIITWVIIIKNVPNINRSRSMSICYPVCWRALCVTCSVILGNLSRLLTVQHGRKNRFVFSWMLLLYSDI